MSSATVIVCFLIYLSSAATATVNVSSLSAYDLLQEYDFPVGLLPQGITGYELDPATGKFRAYLKGTCTFSIQGSYQLKYKSTISGTISKDMITGLSGISVKILFLWLNIVEVIRSEDELRFSVGVASADFTIDNFLASPRCGCGFDCVTGSTGNPVTNLRTNPFVSSI